MVDPFNTKFTPGTIDDQIDQHLNAQDHEHDSTLSRSDHSGPSATRIVKTLQEHYVSAQDHGQALERVWERFSAQRAPLETVLRDASDTRISPVKQRVRAPGNPVRLRIPISDVPVRRSGLLAAVVCLVLIVGSMAVLPRLTHHSSPASSGTSNITPTATTATIIGEQPAYGVLPGAGTAYLYKGISPIRAGQSQLIYSPVQFKAHTGKLVEVNTQGAGAKLWSYKGDLFSIPILVDDVLYVPGQGGLDVMRAGDHTLLWHQSILLTPHMVSNGTLYAFGQDGGLEALRVSDGVLLWHSQYKFAWIDNNIVYAIEGFDYINALRANDGRLLWRTRLVDSSVSVGGGVVFLHASLSYGIRALDGKTGALLWSNEHIDNNILAVQNGIIYVLAHDMMVALRARTGQILWQYRDKYQPAPISGAWLSGDVAYINTTQDNAQQVRALHSGDGKVLWRAKTSGWIKLLQDGVLYLDRPGVGDPGALFALRASDGSVLWQRDDIEHVYNAPILARSGVVYVTLADNKTIAALKASNGIILAHYSMDSL